MGNVLTASVPSQILPVQAYLTELKDVEFIKGLGSTRFMKVARVENVDGASVFKVFLSQDPSFSVEPYRDQILQIRNLLSYAYNCCPFKRVYITDRCTIITRCFQKHTLYDRLSTRPFLLDIEKKWIAFNLFKALAQCEAADICHGDLKSHNVLVSSSGWVQITDFASFKPANIPSDDPSYFSFFFDTSRRLCCYLAPERFYTSQELNLHPNLPGEFMDVSKGLTHSMDIFSLGCLLVELFTEGQCCPFTYDLIVRYKHASDTEAQLIVQNILEQIPKELRRLVGLMLHRNPAKRPTATHLVRKCGAILFPPIFDQFLYNYMNAFRPKYDLNCSTVDESQSLSCMDVDDSIMKLAADVDVIMAKLSASQGNQSDQSPALLILPLVTSNARCLKTLNAKFEVLKLLLRFSTVIDTALVADRILPYMVELLNDNMAQVKCEALHSIKSLLSSFKEIPPKETRLFIDYLFPRLKALSTDRHCIVQMTLAENLGELAEISYRFLNEGSKNLAEDLLRDSTLSEVEAKEREEKLARQEMRALNEAVTEIFVNLCGSHNNVKYSLVTPKSLVKLCQFFNRRKSADILLSHVITFLNDKVDWRLRAAFYECCPIIAVHIGRQSIFILKALLQQGLHDWEEFVQLRALSCICKLFNQDLIDSATMIEFLNDIMPFLIHPNEYLRMAVVNILYHLSRGLGIADTLCKVMPFVEPYVTEQSSTLNNKHVLVSSLQLAIPRSIWSYVMNNSPIDLLIEYLTDKHMYIALDGGPGSVFATNRNHMPINSELDPCLKRLENLGLDHMVEAKLTKFENIISKMHSFKINLGAISSSVKNGSTNMSKLSNIKMRKFDLNTGQKSSSIKANSESGTNYEWKAIFDEEAGFYPYLAHPTYPAFSQGLSNPECALSMSGFSNLGIDQSKLTPCASMLDDLLLHKRERYMLRQKYHPMIYSSSSSTDSNSQLPSVRVGTQPVFHLNEHEAAVNRLSLSPNGCFFASAGSDGVVKLWPLSKFLGSDLSTAARSCATFAISSKKISSVRFMGLTGAHLAIADEDCRLCVVDVQRNHLLSGFRFNEAEEGAPTDIHTTGNLIYVLTHHGNVFCLDCRISNRESRAQKLKTLWRHRMKNEYGLITSLCVDPFSQNWMCMTSTNRYVIFWDLRFGIEVNSWPHPHEACRMLRCWPAHSSSDRNSRVCNEIWTASSCRFELSRWKLETAQRNLVIWPNCGKRAPLDYAVDNHVTTALATCPLSGRIFTGDSVGALRSYNLNNAKECFYLSGPLKVYSETVTTTSSFCKSRASVSYKTVTNNVVELINEVVHHPASDWTTSNPLDLQIATCHEGSISDILCTGDYLISSSRDGVIKIWK